MRSDEPPSKGDAVARADEGDDGVVALLGAAAGDRLEGGLGVAQLVEHLLDHRLVDRLDLGLEPEVLVVAELDLGPNLHDRLEDDRLALLALGDLDLGLSQGREILLRTASRKASSTSCSRASSRIAPSGRARARASLAEPCRGGSPGRGSGARGGRRPDRWPASAARAEARTRAGGGTWEGGCWWSASSGDYRRRGRGDRGRREPRGRARPTGRLRTSQRERGAGARDGASDLAAAAQCRPNGPTDALGRLTCPHGDERSVPTLRRSAHLPRRRHLNRARSAPPSAAGERSRRGPDLNRIGVVFVHGIGTQPACETFLDWSGSIVSVLSDWRTEHGFGPDPVRRCDYDLSGARLPILELDVPEYDGHPAQSWVMTEAWWAATTRSPGSGSMTAYVRHALPGSWPASGESYRLRAEAWAQRRDERHRLCRRDRRLRAQPARSRRRSEPAHRLDGRAGPDPEGIDDPGLRAGSRRRSRWRCGSTRHSGPSRSEPSRTWPRSSRPTTS